MQLEIIAKFSLIDNNGVHKGNVETGKKLDASDMEYSIEEQYKELREKAATLIPDFQVVDLLTKKDKEKKNDKEYK
jgi:hypothetical protein